MKAGFIVEAEKLLIRCQDLCKDSRSAEELNINLAYVRGVCDGLMAFKFFTNIEKERILESCRGLYERR